PRPELAWFLVTRGLWLVLLEITVVHLGWTFDFGYHFLVLQVIWVLGWSMVALAPMVFLPTWAVGALGLAMIAGHNARDGIHGGAWWHVLHEKGPVVEGPHTLFVMYPLMPWVGVMAAGYAFGALLVGDAAARRRRLVWLGLGMLAL